MKKLQIILGFILLSIVGGLSSCKNDNNDDCMWVCILEHFNTTITLTIDASTNLVNVSKSPKINNNDQFHQFRDGDQYILQNDTLFLQTHDSNQCGRPIDCAFAIIRHSKDTMELEFLGGIWLGADYMSNYLFHRKK